MKYSVLMSVYKNDDPDFLKIALESIYDQQTRKPDEVVVVFDGLLNDRLYAVLDEFKKGREQVVYFYPQEVNRGLGEALRIGSELCTGDYILRMDSDDISDKERFAKMSEYVESHPEVDALGGDIAEFNEDPFREETRLRVCPAKHEDIVRMAKRRNPMNHVTACIKKSALMRAGGYQTLLLLEDYLLWLNMIVAGCKLANINETMVYVRVGNGFDSKRGAKERITGWEKLQNIMLENEMIKPWEKAINMLYIKMFVNTPPRIEENNLRDIPAKKIGGVNIVLPCYNCGEVLLETVSSIVNQTFRDWDLMIVDDCSTDDHTKEVLKELSQISDRIKVLTTKVNSGAGVARNVGLDKVNRKYVAFCDADDWWYPDKLSHQLAWMSDNGYDFSCTYYEDADENLEVKSVIKQKAKQNRRDLMSGCNIGTPGVVYRYDSAKEIRFPESRRGEDWGMWMRLLSRFGYIYTLPEVQWKYRHVPQSLNSNKLQVVPAVLSLYKDEFGMSNICAYLTFLFRFMPRYVWRHYVK